MKNASAYAAKIRKLFTQLKRGPKVEWPESPSALEHLMVAILSENADPDAARAALTLLLAGTVDLNDLRVSTPQELAVMCESALEDGRPRITALVQVLNAIYERENCVTLDPLKAKGKKDTRAYLEGLEGITPYVTSCTLMWGYGDHAIAIDDAMLELLHEEELLAPDVDTAQAQSFLERHIRAAEGKDFTLLLKRHALKGQKSRPRKATAKRA